ncbi:MULTISPECIES: helix-turn-helix domain-containing protein [Streptomyces]|uniref:helix-turn-helix domain-containing protein n=1 Tax=Streptomyces TaxID=1883 RepID=UPI0004CD5B06|nr:XRE family transcriptional regulator [Streptomyces sp. NRRL F-5635]
MTPERERLTTALRELRTRTGLSLAALAERTPYSKSSWERYLNGKAVPPRRAVRDLCRLAREPEGRLLALWEIAEAEWSNRAARAAPPRTEPAPAEPEPPGPASAPAAPPPEPGPPQRPPGLPARPPLRHGRLVTVLASVCALAAGSALSAFLLLPHRQGDRKAQASPSAAPAAPGPRCRGAACEGQDPMQMYCGAGPDTLTTERTTTGARVEVRYSPGCQAGWARMWGTRVGDRLEMTAGGPTRRAQTEDEVDTESYVYTVMTAARPGAVVRACFRSASAHAERECVDARVHGAARSSPPR